MNIFATLKDATLKTIASSLEVNRLNLENKNFELNSLTAYCEIAARHANLIFLK
jgi:hypothetical protein